MSFVVSLFIYFIYLLFFFIKISCVCNAQLMQKAQQRRYKSIVAIWTKQLVFNSLRKQLNERDGSLKAGAENSKPPDLPPPWAKCHRSCSWNKQFQSASRSQVLPITSGRVEDSRMSNMARGLNCWGIKVRPSCPSEPISPYKHHLNPHFQASQPYKILQDRGNLHSVSFGTIREHCSWKNIEIKLEANAFLSFLRKRG